jgi:hypothetical protein
MDRFWAKVTQDGDCWVWTSAQRRGYGYFRLRGANVPAHRWAYEAMIAPIPAGLQIDHLCRNRLCVNPYHLEPVTAKVNIQRREEARVAAGMPTHCARGHEFTPENTLVKTGNNGKRACRTCHRDWQRRYARRRAAAKAAI